MKYKTLALHLKNESDESKRALTLRFKILEDSLSQRWALALAEILREDLLLEKHYTFLGFANGIRGLKEIACDINSQVDKINEFGWSGQYRINPELKLNLDSKNGINQDNLNALHHHFETLIGQVWKQSNWFKEAPHSTQIAILFLNNYIHEYEFKMKALEKQKRPINQQKCSSSLSIAFSAAPHFDLKREDYSRFSLDRSFGDLYLHYSQLGKTFEEAFNDQDDHIDEQNISALRYYTGEFDIHLGETGEAQQNEVYRLELNEWLREKGLDPDSEALALGEIKVATLIHDSELAQLSNEEIECLLGQNWHLEKIELKKWIPFLGMNRTYPYTKEETPQLMEAYFKDGYWRKK